MSDLAEGHAGGTDSSEAVRRLVATRSWSGAAHVIQEHPELQSDAAETLLERLATEAWSRGDEQEAQDYQRNGDFLRLCRELGIDGALAEVAARGASVLPAELGALQDEVALAQEAYDATGDPAALDREIDAWEQIIVHPVFSLASASVRLRALQSAAQSLTRRYNLRDDGADLDRAIDAFGRALTVADPDDPDVPNLQSSLGLRLRERYLRTGRPQDLDGAIARMRESVTQPWERSPYFTQYLSNLAAAELDRYHLTGAAGDLDAFVDTADRAAAVGTSDPEFARLLSGAAWGHAERYRSTERRDDLDQAIALYGSSLSAPGGPPDPARVLSDRGWLLLVRYKQDDQIADLQDGLAANEEAARVAAPESPEQSMALTHMATALSLRSARTGALEDLERSLQMYRRLAALPQATLGTPTIMLGLAGALRAAYQRTHDLVRLEEAVTILEDLDRTLPADSPQRLQLLNGLANVLTDRFGAAHATSDLTRAIEVYTQARGLAPTGSQERRVIMNNLGTALADRFRAGGNAEDLDRAIRAFEEATRAAPTGSWIRAGWLLNLADALHDAFDLRGDKGLLERGIAVYKESCTLGLQAHLHSAAQAGSRWGRWAATRHSWVEAAEAFRMSLEAARRLRAIQLRSRHKEAWLEDVRGVPAEASYAMAMAGHLPAAVLTVERGRAMLMSEALQRGGRDLENLAARGHSDLSDRFRRLADELRQLDRSGGDVSAFGPMTEPLQEARAGLRAEFDAVVAAIRSVPEFEGFLAPAELDDVVDASASTPLAFVNAATEGGVALVVDREGEIARLLLPELTVAALQARILRYFASYERPQASDSWVKALDDTTRWSWDVLMGPLLEAISAGGRAVLVPGGLLAFLPLHAAWTPDPSRPTGRRYALDDALLTYAPNARTLAVAHRQAADVDPDAVLAVEAPSPVSAAPLLFAEPEVDAVVAAFDRSRRLRQDEATRAAVLAELPNFPVLHFACHGAADVEEPLRSALLMAHDERLTLDDLMGARMKTARIAVLSACETAMTGARLPDEVIGLPAGLMQAGVPGVIGSLWQVPDFAAMSIMSLFYEGWQEDHLEPAEALRRAQRSVRDGDDADAPPHTRGVARARDPSTAEAHEAARRRRRYAHPLHWAGFQYVGV